MHDRTWLVDLYAEQRQPLFLAAWNVLRCVSLAEDALHSAFARLATLSTPPREPKVYAFRAVRNAALDVRKVRSRRREVSLEGIADRPDVEVLPNADDSQAAVTTALEQLDDVAREIIELRLQSGLTFQEIAAVMEQPLPTVASRYRRAILKMQSMLEVCHE